MLEEGGGGEKEACRRIALPASLISAPVQRELQQIFLSMTGWPIAIRQCSPSHTANTGPLWAS